MRNSVAIVTGASQGIGHSTAIRLARDFSSIVLVATFGRIDGLLNIAGAVPQIDLLEMTDAQWESGLALKLHGARRLMIAACPALKEARGSVVSPGARWMTGSTLRMDGGEVKSI